MKNLLFVVAAVFIFFTSNSQTTNSEVVEKEGFTSFYAELGGPGILFSANIDSRFTKSRFGLGGRIGIGFVTADESTYDPNGNWSWEPASVITVPVQLNYIFGKGNTPHAFEVGAGITYVGKKLDIMNFYDSRKANVFGTASFMYRRQPVNGGFTWRAGFTPIFASGYIQPFGGVGVGYNF